MNVPTDYFSHSSRARSMTIETLRTALICRAAPTPSGHMRTALPGETRAFEAELARRAAAEAAE